MPEKNDSRFVTIVSGLPRSGTSLMMQMLGAGGLPVLTDNVRVADEDNPRGYYELEAVKRTKQDPSWVEQARGKVVKLVHLLILDLPPGYEYRIIFMRREMDEVIVSQDVMLQRMGKQTGTMTPEKMKAVFLEQINRVQMWIKAHRTYSMIEVKYNELIVDPLPSIERIAAFLPEAGLDKEAMREVVDPSLYRQRRR